MISDISKTEKRFILDFVKLGQFSISVLVVYYMWYNIRYGHSALVVYGSFLLMCACLLIDMLEEGELSFDDYHIGIWGNFTIVLYSFFTGFFVAYSQSGLLESLKLLLQYAVISFATYHFAKKSENGLNWFLITVNFAALLSCYSLVTHPVELVSGRFSLSLWNNPNTLGFMLVMGIFSIVYRFKPNIKWLIFNFPQIMLMMYGVIRTGSRKSLIAGMVLLILWIIETLKDLQETQDRLKTIIMLIIFLIMLFIGGRYMFSTYSQSRLAFRMENMLDDESNDNRINYYISAWRIFFNKPLLGGGLDQFKYWSGIGGYAHSTYAEAIADFGLIGCIIYFIPILGAGIELIEKVASSECSCQRRIVLGLWFVEIFMGVGQIFFLDIMHFWAWTIIYIHACSYKEKNIIRRESKYIRT